MNEMKNSPNIEELLSKLKKSYKVPEEYFNQLEDRVVFRPETNKSFFQRFYIKLGIAASLILLLGLGFYFQNKKTESLNTETKLAPSYTHQQNNLDDKDFFEDIDEQAIEDYIEENGLIEEYYDENFL